MELYEGFAIINTGATVAVYNLNLAKTLFVINQNTIDASG
jgi:hypothetical protein